MWGNRHVWLRECHLPPCRGGYWLVVLWFHCFLGNDEASLLRGTDDAPLTRRRDARRRTYTRELITLLFDFLDVPLRLALVGEEVPREEEP